MTAPATFNSPARIIENAMENAVLLAEGDTPNSEQYAKYLVRLTDLINFWATQGLKLWTLTDLSVPLTAGQAKYTIGPSGNVVMPKPMREIQAYYLNSDSIRRPLYIISWDEYLRLSQVTQTGAINSVFVDKQQTQINVSCWLVPDADAATGTLHLLTQQQLTNPVTLTEALNFTSESFIALHWMLAAEICNSQPQAVIDRCTAMAATYRQALEAWDVEDAATQFQPDHRTAYGTNNFR